MNSPLELYLDRVGRALWCVPATWRAEQILEVRQHLTARADELMATGLTQTEAEEEAVCRFGSARETARHLIVAWWRQLLPLDALGLRAALLVAISYVILSVADQYKVVCATHDGNVTAIASLPPLVYYCLKLIACFTFGYAAARVSAKRAFVGVFWGGVASTAGFRLYTFVSWQIQLLDPNFRAWVERQTVLKVGITSPALWVVLVVTAMCLGVCAERCLPTRRLQRA